MGLSNLLPNQMLTTDEMLNNQNTWMTNSQIFFTCQFNDFNLFIAQATEDSISIELPTQ